jgi:hypothetical protein
MQEAAEHDVWYEQYLEHLNQKKIAIAKWKEEKRPEVVILEPVIELKRVDPVKEEERQRERELQKYAVMLWKVFRLNKAEKEKKRQEEEERIKAEEREKQERMRRAVKERLRNQHETPKPKTPSPEPIKKPIIVDKDLLKRQKERELKYFEKQIKLKQRQEEQERLKAQRLEKLKSTVRVVVERDPERLFQPTKGQLQKPQDTVAVGGLLVRAQRRMIPDWRIGCQ